MVGFTQTQKVILGKYTRAIIHMRKRLTELKFSLVFGAGISRDFGIPDWDTLINNIANDNLVRGQRLLKRTEDCPNTSKTQVLFHHFAAKLNLKKKNNELNDSEIRKEWRNIVRKHLYKKGKSIEQIKRGNHYIKSFIEIIKKCHMTVTYNFDDYIEKILEEAGPKEEEKLTRGYETIWDPQLQTRRSDSVIYHPNGFLPTRKLERQSDGLVFCEDEFADQLIESMAGRYASLLHHYSQNTCLFLGLSLDDSTLKHLLRQSSKLNPGHYHYYVYYLKNDQKLSIEERDAIYEANFNLYNLITLFLTNKEIKELAGLIQLDNERFIIKAQIDNIQLIYCYYVVGAIKVGKSTITSYFRNLFTHDEWPDFRIPELGKDWETLSQRQKDKVDNWVAGQFKKKNRVLHNFAYGIHIIDRAPLDPLAFTNRNERKQKANFLINNICDEEVGIKAGHVILLLGDPESLEKRARSSDKEYTAEKLDDMQKVLQRIYYSKNKLSIVNTKNKRLEKIIKEIGKIIHKLEYREINLNLRLKHIKGGRFDVSKTYA